MLFMMEINQEKLHEFMQNIDENDQDKIEELGFSLLVYQKMRGNIQLPVEDFLKMKELFVKHYYSNSSRELSEWCLLVSGYLVKYNQYDAVMELFETALEDIQLRYYTDQKNVAVLEIYITVLFYIAEHYFKERKDYIYAVLYYAKAYELLISQSKEIRDKMKNYDQLLDDIFEKIELLMKMAEDNKLIDMRMLTSMLNSIVQYCNEE